MVSIWAEVMIPAGDGAGQTISTVPEAPGTGGCSGSSASLNADGLLLVLGLLSKDSGNSLGQDLRHSVIWWSGQFRKTVVFLCFT